ncbi:E3 ubiquitin-protein ligase RNF14 [Euphorbia peplus]|nr:E3 ubiquitin-protein ligase RNF14 [Euphorbia peplus]
MLDSIWMEQPGQEVMYQWVEWLQNSSLSHLGIDNEITLGPYGIRYCADTRAVSTSVSLDIDVPSLMSYNDEQCHEKFLKSAHKCVICYNEYAGSDFIRLLCHHLFCLNCLKTYSNIHVSEGSVKKLKCPDMKCEGMIPPGLRKQLLGTERYERWESLMLQKTLDYMSDLEYCPRCQTPCIEDEDHHAQCPKCLFSFCTRCRSRWHVGAQCETAETRLQILQAHQNSWQLIDKQKSQELEKINELLSVREIFRDSRQCPSCKIAISKTEGCNKMTCRNCGQYFYYCCGESIHGYDHFEDDEACPTAAPPQGPARHLAELDAKHVKLCPGCGQLNAKVDNNNHVRCWACQTRFCYSC